MIYFILVALPVDIYDSIQVDSQRIALTTRVSLAVESQGIGREKSTQGQSHTFSFDTSYLEAITTLN